MTFPIISKPSPDSPPISRIYPNLYVLATEAPNDHLAYWPDPTISSQSQFELLYKHNLYPDQELSFDEMRMVLLFAYYFTTW